MLVTAVCVLFVIKASLNTLAFKRRASNMLKKRSVENSVEKYATFFQLSCKIPPKREKTFFLHKACKKA